MKLIRMINRIHGCYTKDKYRYFFFFDAVIVTVVKVSNGLLTTRKNGYRLCRVLLKEKL